MSIHYIPYNTIDKTKWDSCIKNSFNGLIWGFSWYLDIVCEKWDAIVEGDYQKVMPLPYVQKYNQYHVVIPPFVKQLGVFSIDKLTSATVDSFIAAIPEKFKEVSIPLNDMNKTSIDGFKYQEMQNFQLDLIQLYENTADAYSLQNQAKIGFAREQELTFTKKITVSEFESFIKTVDKKWAHSLSKKEEQILTNLITTLSKFSLAELYGVYDSNNQLCATALFLIYLNRLSLINIAVSDNGDKCNAHHFLIDEFIRQNSSKNVTLDLLQNAQGEWLEFNQGFGCTRTVSYFLYRNNLSLLYKLIE